MKQFAYTGLKFFVFGLLVYCLSVIAVEELSPLGIFKKNLNYRIGGSGHLFTRLQGITQRERR